MPDDNNRITGVPPEQEAIRNRCFHPSGTFVEFQIEDLDSSVPAHFEKIVQMYPDRIAVETDSESVTNDTLNRAANRLANLIQASGPVDDMPVAVILAGECCRRSRL